MYIHTSYVLTIEEKGSNREQLQREKQHTSLIFKAKYTGMKRPIKIEHYKKSEYENHRI
jgi:hypothetical protein